jgi:3,4-dihydroxy-2-butanone 4-phosphate synthase
LGRPDPSKLKAKIYTFDPSHLGFVDPQRPFLVLKEQGHTEHHADLNRDKGGRLTAVCGEIKERRFAFEVILSKKE